MNFALVQTNLRRLRRARGLSQDEVASRAGLSRVGYRNLETGISTPRVDTLARIAAALDVGLEDVILPLRSLREVRFRAAKRLTSRENLLADVGRWLDDYGEVEALTGRQTCSDLAEARRHVLGPVRPEPREAARRAREWLRVSDEAPVRDLCGLLEDRGIKVHTPEIASDAFFGLSVAEGDGGPAVVVNCWARISVERWIFTAAHEFGHLLLHLDAYDVREHEEDEGQEREANVFASHFLMPDRVFLRELEESRGLPLYQRAMKLKRIFRVSYKTVLYRMAEQLPEGASLWRRFQWEYARVHGHGVRGHEEPEGLAPAAFHDGRPAARSVDEPDRLLPTDFIKDRLHRLVREAVELQRLPLARAAEVLRLPLVEMLELEQSWQAQREAPPR